MALERFNLGTILWYDTCTLIHLEVPWIVLVLRLTYKTTWHLCSLLIISKYTEQSLSVIQYVKCNLINPGWGWADHIMAIQYWHTLPKIKSRLDLCPHMMQSPCTALSSSPQSMQPGWRIQTRLMSNWCRLKTYFVNHGLDFILPYRYRYPSHSTNPCLFTEYAVKETETFSLPTKPFSWIATSQK